jgi:alkyl hydroperoxide reductase subunit AhpC
MAVVLCAVLLICAGCGRTVNKAAYNKLKIGMSYEEVIKILGSANTCDATMGAKSCLWGNEQKNISVKFIADMVVFFTSKGL